MFGYVLPKSETLSLRDYSMFRALYCGICIATKHRYGNLARFTVNYDITAFALLAIEAMHPEVTFSSCRCLGDVRKKPYVEDSAFMQTMADVNILLCRYKAYDDMLDGGKRSVIMSVLKKPYEKAAAALPEADRIISESYEKLRKAETENIASLDRVSDCFASMLERLFAEVALGGVTDEYYIAEMRKLCYNIGKFVYLADAVDDIDEDHRAGRYNPVLAVMPDYENGKPRDYKTRHRAELEFALNSTVNRAIECVNHIGLSQVNDLLRNIIYEGMRAKTDELLAADKKLPPPTLRASEAAKEEMRELRKRKKADKGKNEKG